MRSLGISLLCTQIWGSYNMRLWERRYSHHLDDDFTIAGSEADWSNAFWLVFVTMTSVGYGDYYPNTHLGRVTAAVCVLLFTLFISLFIGVVADEMQLGSAQEKVYEYADAHANHQRVRQIAAEVLTQFLRAKATPDFKKKPWLKPQWVHSFPAGVDGLSGFLSSQQLQARPVPVSVSYTHLTLPTILLV